VRYKKKNETFDWGGKYDCNTNTIYGIGEYN
jgi:hypothetical protein